MRITESNKFLALLITGLVLFFWLQNGSDFVFILIAFSFLFYAKGRVLDELEKNYFVIFLVSLIATAILAIVHFDLVFDSPSRYFTTLFRIGVFCAFMVTVDAVGFQFNYFKIDAVKFAKILIYAVLFSIVANLIWAYITHPNVPLLKLIFGSWRSSYLGLDINSNHADDLFVLQITILLFCNSILFIEGKKDIIAQLCSGLLVIYLLYNIGVLGSRGGMLGLASGLIIMAFLLATLKSWKACSVYLIILIVGIAVVPKANLNRLIDNISFFQSVSVLKKELMVNSALEKKKQSTEIDKRPNRVAGLRTAKSLPTQKKTLIPKMLPVSPRGEANLVVVEKSELEKRCNVKQSSENHSKDITLDFSSRIRLSLWADGINVGSQRPIFGHGQYNKHQLVKNYNFAMPCKFVSFSHIHNFYIDLFIRGGYFALITFLGLSIALLWMLLRLLFSNNKYSLLAAPAIVHMNYLFIENIFDLTFFRTSELLNVMLCLAALCGVTFALQKRGEQKSKL